MGSFLHVKLVALSHPGSSLAALSSADFIDPKSLAIGVGPMAMPDIDLLVTAGLLTSPEGSIMLFGQLPLKKSSCLICKGVLIYDHVYYHKKYSTKMEINCPRFWWIATCGYKLCCP